MRDRRHRRHHAARCRRRAANIIRWTLRTDPRVFGIATTFEIARDELKPNEWYRSRSLRPKAPAITARGKPLNLKLHAGWDWWGRRDCPISGCEVPCRYSKVSCHRQERRYGKRLARGLV